MLAEVVDILALICQYVGKSSAGFSFEHGGIHEKMLYQHNCAMDQRTNPFVYFTIMAEL